MEVAPILSADETALYDRQIRLWGVEAQSRLGKANILFCGFTSVQAEICKNLVLAGIKSVTINDTRICDSSHTGAHLFLNHNSIGKSCSEASQEGVKLLNPHVVVSTSALSMDEIGNSFDKYHLVCVSGLTPNEIINANTMARSKNTYFFNVDTFGYFGYMFEDLGKNYTFEKENEKKEKINQSIDMTPLSSALESKNSTPLFVVIKTLFNFWKIHSKYPTQDDHEEFKKIKDEILSQTKITNREKNKINDMLLQKFIQHLGTELSPICAIVGGVVAQEILKVICHNDKPFNNSFFFNGLDDSGLVAELS